MVEWHVRCSSYKVNSEVFCPLHVLLYDSEENSVICPVATFQGWCVHTDDTGESGNIACTVCQHYADIQRGGRPLKPKKLGRPPGNSPRYCIDHIREVAPQAFVESGEKVSFCESHHSVPLEDLNCPLCHNMLSCPVELVTCRMVVCAECLCDKLNQQNNLLCPCCNTDHVQDFTTIQQAPSLVVNVLGRLCVVCSNCKAHIQLKSYQEHLASRCTPSVSQVLPQTSIDDVLHQPTTAPLSTLEQKLQTTLARRSLTSSTPGGGVLQLER